MDLTGGNKGKINFEIGLDNERLKRDAEEAQRIIDSIQQATEQNGKKIDDTIKKIGMTIGGVFAADKLMDYAKQVANVRGEYQKLEIAFKTMLGSEEKANTLMNQLIKTAATTPFGMNEVTSGAKQLLAFGESAETVNNTLIRLGDIAAGTGAHIGQLTNVYGQIMAAGRMNGGDLLQFVNAGVPIIKALADTMGVAESNVKELISRGKVGFPEVRAAIESLTDEGSKFGGMMEAQSHSLTGQMSNIEDSIEQMFNEIGKMTEGKIEFALEVTSKLIDNWKAIGVAIMGVLSVYGGYKAAVMSTYVAEKVAKSGSLLGWLKETVAIKGATGAVTAFNTAVKANPLAFIIGLLTTAASAFALFHSSAELAAEDVEKFGESATKQINSVDTLTTQLKGLTVGSSAHKKALEELNGILKEYGLKQLDEKSNIDAINQSREYAIQLIKEEGIERQKANAIEAASQEYQEGLKDIGSRIESDMSSFFISDGKRGWSGEKEMAKNAKAIKAIIMNAFAEGTDKSAEELSADIRRRLEAAGLDAEGIMGAISSKYKFDFSDGNVIDHYIEQYIDLAEAQKNAIDQADKVEKAERKHADSGIDAAKRQEVYSNLLHDSSENAKDLYESVSKLVGKKNGELDYKINVSDVNVPSWMKNMDLETLKKNAEVFTSSGAAGTSVKGSNLNRQQTLERGLQYALAAKQLQEQQEESEKQSAENAKKLEQEAKQLAKEKKKRLEEIEKYREDVKAAEKQAEAEIAAKKVEMMDDGYGKRLATINLNYDRMIAAIDAREREMVNALKKNQLNEWLNRNPKATEDQQKAYLKSLKTTGKDLTETQQKQLQEFRKVAEETKQIELSNLTGTEEAINEYLKQYGDYQAKKYAMAQEWAAKIKEVEKSSDSQEMKEWKIRSIKQEQKAYNDQAEANMIMQRIDWTSVFGGLGGIMSDALKPMLEDLKAYTKTNNFKSLGVDQQRQIIEAMKSMRSQIGDSSDLNWKDLAKDMQAYQESLRQLKAAQEQYAAVESDVLPAMEKAREDLAKAKAMGDEPAMRAANDALAEFANRLAGASDGLNNAKKNVQTSGQQLSQTAEAVLNPVSKISAFLNTANLGQLGEIASSIDQLRGAIGGLKAVDAAKSIADKAGEVATATGEAAEKIGEAGASAAEQAADAAVNGIDKAGLIGKIIAAIIKILELLKDQGIGEIFKTLVEGISDGIEGLIKNMSNGSDIKNGFTGISDLIGGILEGVFGSSLNFFTGGKKDNIGEWLGQSNVDAVVEATERLTKQNEYLGESIDKLREDINGNYGSTSIKAYMDAAVAQLNKNETLRELLNVQQGYHNAHHSNDRYWNMSQESTDAVNKLLGTNLRNNYWSDWATLTAEQMNTIREQMVNVWLEMEAQGKYDKSEYFEQYADEAGKFEELENQIRENLLGMSFDSLRDSFIDTLMDMDADAEDFAEDFTEMMQRSLLQAKFDDLFSDDLEAWYNGVTSAMMDLETGTFKELDPLDVDYWRKEYDKIVQKGLDLRNSISGVTGYTSDSEREGSSKGIATASQETVDELNGRATAIQGHTYSICENTKILVSSVNGILQSVQNIDNNIDGMPARLANMESDIKSMSNTLNDISLKGLKVK